jgi:hypothetical protein
MGGKRDARKKSEESCLSPGGKNIQQGSFRRTELRNRNRCYTMGKLVDVGAPLPLRSLPTLSEEVKERFP